MFGKNKLSWGWILTPTRRAPFSYVTGHVTQKIKNRLVVRGFDDGARIHNASFRGKAAKFSGFPVWSARAGPN